MNQLHFQIHYPNTQLNKRDLKMTNYWILKEEIISINFFVMTDLLHRRNFLYIDILH